MPTAPRTIFLIRHGEKPADSPPPAGVTIDGQADGHSLIPRGWQRAGALATLFAPQVGPLRPDILTPTQLIAPPYASSAADERTHQTIHPLEQLLGLHIESPYPEGQEADLGSSVAAGRSGVTLICWEHKALHVIAGAIAPPGTPIPQSWPGDRFDVMWCFTLDSSSDTYTFTQVPQLLLDGDSPTVIPT